MKVCDSSMNISAEFGGICDSCLDIYHLISRTGRVTTIMRLRGRSTSLICNVPTAYDLKDIMWVL